MPCLTKIQSQKLKTSLRGRLIAPGDKDYDEARKIYNGMIHKKPRLIARCNDVADVINSVNFARENPLLLAIRRGGHNAGGLGICEDGFVIDLSPIKYTRIDPAAHTVTVGGGCVRRMQVALMRPPPYGDHFNAMDRAGRERII